MKATLVISQTTQFHSHLHFMSLQAHERIETNNTMKGMNSPTFPFFL